MVGLFFYCGEEKGIVINEDIARVLQDALIENKNNTIFIDSICLKSAYLFMWLYRLYNVFRFKESTFQNMKIYSASRFYNQYL